MRVRKPSTEYTSGALGMLVTLAVVTFLLGAGRVVYERGAEGIVAWATMPRYSFLDLLLVPLSFAVLVAIWYLMRV